MASYNLNTMILTLIMIYSIIVTHGVEDIALINKMCAKTYAPNVCNSCIKSDGKDAKTDVDVILQMLGCLVKDAKDFENDVNNILKDAKTESQIKEALETLKPYLSSIIIGGEKVQPIVGKREFSNAKVIMTNIILGNLKAINSVVSNSFDDKIVIPPPIFSGVFNTEANSKICDQLIASSV